MPRLSPIQESFNAGFLGKRVRGRVSSDVYKQGLSECTNWYPLVQGPIRLRAGSEFVSNVDTNNWVAGEAGAAGIRVFTFQRGVDQDSIVEVGADNIRVLGEDGSQVIGGQTDNLLNVVWLQYLGMTEYWDPDLDKYIFGTDPGRFKRYGFDNGIGSSLGVFLGFIRGAILSAEISQSPQGFHGPALETAASHPIILPAGSETLLNEIKLTLTPYFLPTVHNLDPKVRVSVGTTKGGNDVYTTDLTPGNLWVDQEVTLNFTPGVGNNTLFFSVGLVWTGADTIPNYTAPWGDTGNSMAVAVSQMSWIAPLAGGSGTGVSFASPYTAAQMECLQFIMDPGEQVAYFFHPEVEPRRLRLDNGEWTFEALSAITQPSAFQGPTPNNWGVGNYPACGCFHEGRLVMGGSPVDPGTVWGSRSGDYQDFNNVTPDSKDDPYLFPLSTAGRIKCLTSRKALVINTDISEVIGESFAGVIAYDDFYFPKQTDWGTNCIQPMVVGRDMIFTSNSRRTVRTFKDKGDSENGWDGNEISLLAEELFSSQVTRMVYLNEPARQACFLLDNGTMAMATYFYEEDVIGWWKYETAYNDSPDQIDNRIIDITKINTSEGDKLWMVVNRVGFSDTDYPQHELLTFESRSGLQHALDTHVTRLIDPTVNTISDLAIFNDQTVDCIIMRDDPVTAERSYTVHPPLSVVAGVSSALEPWAQQEACVAFIGHFYTNQIKLLPREGVSNRGTSQVSKIRWNKIVLRLSDSAVPLVEGEYPKDRTPATVMGTGEEIVTGDVEYSELGTGKGDIEVTQDRPLITEVDAIFGKVTSGEI